MENPPVVVYAALDLRIEDAGVPQPAVDEAVVDIAFGGVCGSDLHYWMHRAAGASVLREPMVLGREVAGVIAIPAADGSGPVAGTPVAMYPLTALDEGRTPWPREHS